MAESYLIGRNPVISVLLPVYDAESYLRVAIQSVLTQTFQDFELLIFNDGSTDRSLSIAREFEALDHRVRVLSRTNGGIVRALNELVLTARGRYLARMDGDDICRPERFATQLAHLEAHSGCVAVGSQVLLIDPEGMPICEFVTDFTHEEIDAAHLSGFGASRMCHPSVMMRRDAVIRAGLYNERYRLAEDIDLFLRLAEVGRLANLRETLIKYRQHLRSSGYAQGYEQHDVARLAMKAAWERRGLTVNPELPEITIKRESAWEVHCKWAWWSLSAGNLATARKHAVRALALEPFSVDSLRVVACAVRGH
jgi:glycosyltransferase involved in cell wall biosynthesis